MLAMMMLQATVSANEPVNPINFDLKSTVISKSCTFDPSRIDDDEILICGRRDANDRYRLKPLDTARFEPNKKAETTLIGDLKGAAEVESKEIAPGLTSNRIMLRLKLPF